jgi:hypothetical protein
MEMVPRCGVEVRNVALSERWLETSGHMPDFPIQTSEARASSAESRAVKAQLVSTSIYTSSSARMPNLDTIQPANSSTMNTIAPPPQIKRLPPGRRALGIALGFIGGGIANVAIGYAGFTFWTRQTKFVPYDTTSADLQTSTFKSHNPASNPPVCILNHKQGKLVLHGIVLGLLHIQSVHLQSLFRVHERCILSNSMP